MSDSNAAPRDIEQDLSATRARLGGHLSELRSRTTPGQILDELMVYFRGKEGAEFGRNLMDGVRSNPLPAAITGIGLTWLMASNPGAVRASSAGVGGDNWSGFSTRQPNRTGQVGTPDAEPTREPYETESAFSKRRDVARAKSLGIGREPDEDDSTFMQRVGNALSSAKQATLDAGRGVRDTGADLASSVGSGAQDASSALGSAARSGSDALTHGGRMMGDKGGNLISTLVDSPVLLGALGLAAGALLGALLPQSDQEEEALSGVADQARQSARGLAQEAADRGGELAQSVADTAQGSARSHGLTGERSTGDLVDAALSGDLADDAKQVAEDVLHEGDRAIRKHTDT